MRLALGLCGIFAAAPAFADPNAFVDVSQPPSITGTVFGNINLATTDCTLHEGDVSIAAHASAPLTAKPTMAISFVVLANAIFAGGLVSDRGWQVDERRRPLAAFGAAVDQAELASLAGPDSRFEIIGYSTGARSIKPWTPIAELRADSFGVAKDYEMGIGSDLVTGLGTAIDHLEHVRAERKVLIVIGDGSDTNNETARDLLPELGIRARYDHIETYAISMKTEISPDTMVIEDMIQDAQVATGREGIATELAAISHRLSQREAFVFAADQLAWNGLRHYLVLMCPGGLRVETTVVLPQWAPPTHHISRLPKLLLLGGVVLLALALIARKHFR